MWHIDGQVPELLHRVLAHGPGEGPHTVRAGGGGAGHGPTQEAPLTGNSTLLIEEGFIQKRKQRS